MRFSMTFTQAQRDRAKAEDKALFGVSVRSVSGGLELTGLTSHETADTLFLFAGLLYKGKAPREAFDESFGLEAAGSTRSAST